MTKSLLIDPAAMRAPGALTGPTLPLNAYVSDPAAEARAYGQENLVRIYRDMVVDPRVRDHARPHQERGRLRGHRV